MKIFTFLKQLSLSDELYIVINHFTASLSLVLEESGSNGIRKIPSV